MPLSRLFNFIPGERILAEEWVAELDQLYRFLSGSLSGQLFLIQNTLNPSLILQNIKAGKPILTLQRDGVSLLRILENQQLQSLVTEIAPIDVVSQTVVTKLNAEFLDDLPDTNFILVNTRHTEYFIPFLFKNATVVPTVIGSFIVPAGTNMSMTSVFWKCISPLGDDTSSATVSLRKNGVAIDTIELFFNNFVTHALATGVVENDVISVTLDSIIDAGQEKVLARVKFKQDLSA